MAIGGTYGGERYGTPQYSNMATGRAPYGGMGGFMGGMGTRGSGQTITTPSQPLPTQPSAQYSSPQLPSYTPYGGGGGGGAGGGAVPPSGGGVPGAGGEGGPFGDPGIGVQRQVAQGLMEPGSDYFTRLADQLQGRIGKQSQAAQRAAALRGAYSGFGGGMSPESMQSAADIAAGGQEAMGAAGADLALRAPQLGIQAMQGTFQPQLGWGQLGEQSRQFGQNLSQRERQMAEQSRQFGAGLGMQGTQMSNQMGLAQQQIAAQQAWQQAQIQQQQQAQQNQYMMQMMSGLFGGF